MPIEVLHAVAFLEFQSERFSRCGESFCYVKVDGADGAVDSEFEDKGDIEDALDAVLVPKNRGCSIGGGTGRRYSHIDLALTDLDKGVEEIRKRLQTGKLPKRSWIQFHDADFVAEWVGIYDDTPAPPMPDFE